MVSRLAANVNRAIVAVLWVEAQELQAGLAGALTRIASPHACVLVDCLTLWVSNLLGLGRNPALEGDDLLSTLAGLAGPVVFVSNEVGLGLVPETPLGRAFRDAQGRLNMRMAERADRVVLMAAGLPLLMKDRPVRT